MRDVVSLAAEWESMYATSVATAQRSSVGQPLSTSKVAQMKTLFMNLGLCQLVTHPDGEMARQSFQTAVWYWLQDPPHLSNQVSPALEMAAYTGNDALTAQLISQIHQPWPELLETPEHHLAALLIQAIMGAGGPQSQEHRAVLARAKVEYRAYGEMLGGVIEGDPTAILAGAMTYLQWHHRHAEKGYLSRQAYGLVAMPVLVSLSLARRRGIQVAVEDPYVPRMSG